jgi:hypothetical protein
MIRQNQPYETQPNCCICIHHPQILFGIDSLSARIYEIGQRIGVIEHSQHSLLVRIEQVARENEEQNRTIQTQFAHINHQIQQLWQQRVQPVPESSLEKTEKLEALQRELAETKREIKDLQNDQISRTLQSTNDNLKRDELISSLLAAEKTSTEKNGQLLRRMTLLEEKLGRQHHQCETANAKRGTECALLKTHIEKLTAQTEQIKTDQNSQLASLQLTVQQIKKTLPTKTPTEIPMKTVCAKVYSDAQLSEEFHATQVPLKKTLPAKTPTDIPKQTPKAKAYSDDQLLEKFHATHPPLKEKAKPFVKQEDSVVETLKALINFLTDPFKSDFTLTTRSLITGELMNDLQEVVKKDFLSAQSTGNGKTYVNSLRHQGFEIVFVHKITKKQYPLS